MDTGNPLFEAWVNRVDLALLLTQDDLAGSSGGPPSLLNGAALEPMARKVIDAVGARGPSSRSYFANPLRTFLTVTNLTGVPYGLPMTGNQAIAHGMRSYADHVRFALNTGTGASHVYADEMELPPVADTAAQPWDYILRSALACGAFPAALPAQALTRFTSDYDSRVVTWTDPLRPTPRPPDWTDQGRFYEFLGVDGGCMNNEPLDLARKVLAGANGRNPRDPVEANRATILVDPFPEPPDPGPSTTGTPMLRILGGLVTAWIQQCRFKPEDLALANQEDVYSRYLITPSREGDTGASAGHHLACGLLGGFGGFLSRDMRLHDFMLGRRNAQRFLQRHLAIPSSNKVLAAGYGDPTVRQNYAFIENGTEYLPVIPIVKSFGPFHNPIEDPEPLPAWRAGGIDFDSLERQLVSRVDKVLDGLLDANGFGGVLIGAYLAPARLMARRRLSKFVQGDLRGTLRSWKLT